MSNRSGGVGRPERGQGAPRTGDAGSTPAADASSAAQGQRDPAEIRAANWEPFVLLRTVIDQSPSSLRTEALIVLAQLQQRVEDAEALGDA